MEVSPISICVGCGLDVSDTGVLEVQKRPNGGLGCTNTGAGTDGLFLTAFTGDTATGHMHGTGTLADPLLTDVRKSTQPCNGIRLDGDGVYASCPKSIIGHYLQTSPQGIDVAHPMAIDTLGLARRDFLNDNAFNSIHVCNTTCCTVEGFISVRTGDLWVNAVTGLRIDVNLLININNTGFVAVSPSTELLIDNPGPNQFHSLNGIAYSQWLIEDPGVCFDFQWLYRVHIQNGTGTLYTNSNGPSFFTSIQLNQTNCPCT